MLIDTDVLIAAYQNYYAPDLCQGFWDFISHHFDVGQLFIIDRVRGEIKSPNELVKWVGQIPQHAHMSTSPEPVSDAYHRVMDWVVNNQQFTYAAKDKFARDADPWLIACAIVHNVDVVTNEVFDPNIKRAVKIPNVCDNFGVGYGDTYVMLRKLGAQFTWERPSLPCMRGTPAAGQRGAGPRIPGGRRSVARDGDRDGVVCEVSP